MARLHQILALREAEKPRAERGLTNVYHQLQRWEPLSGITRTYEPIDREGEQFPEEGTLVQVRVPDLLDQARDSLTRLFDLTLTHEVANARAHADVKVDDQVLLKNVPVTYLLFLERKLIDLHTLVSKLPTLDPAQKWTWDAATSCFRTPPTRSTKSKKIPRNHVKAEATERHPAQVELWYEDVVVGYWTTTKFSGALQADRIAELLSRVRKLQDAVKVAREEANSTQVDEAQAGKFIFDYLLG
jgi:hypothetical protein